MSSKDVEPPVKKMRSSASKITSFFRLAPNEYSNCESGSETSNPEQQVGAFSSLSFESSSHEYSAHQSNVANKPDELSLQQSLSSDISFAFTETDGEWKLNRGLHISDIQKRDFLTNHPLLMRPSNIRMDARKVRKCICRKCTSPG